MPLQQIELPNGVIHRLERLTIALERIAVALESQAETFARESNSIATSIQYLKGV